MHYNIRVLLCGDPPNSDRLMRESLSRMPSVQIVAQTHSSSAAFVIIQRVRPALVLLVLPMPQLDAVETARQLLAQAPEAKLLAICSCWNSRGVHEMLSVGAAGCLLTQGEPDELVRAIQTVMFGGQYLSPGILHPNPPVGGRGAHTSKGRGGSVGSLPLNPEPGVGDCQTLL
jgi:DNA-binding NarL/FixJ family response regulator